MHYLRGRIIVQEKVAGSAEDEWRRLSRSRV